MWRVPRRGVEYSVVIEADPGTHPTTASAALPPSKLPCSSWKELLSLPCRLWCLIKVEPLCSSFCVPKVLKPRKQLLFLHWNYFRFRAGETEGNSVSFHWITYQTISLASDLGHSYWIFIKTVFSMSILLLEVENQTSRIWVTGDYPVQF